MRKKSAKILSIVLASAMVATAFAAPKASTNEVQAATGDSVIAREDISRVTVHDPSIVKDPTGGYYIFGSHMATAKTDDLVNWTQVSTDYKYAKTGNDPVYGDVLTNFADSFKWAGYDDGDCAGGNFAVWAPDVFYDEAYEWGDGSKGAWLMYYSASSTWKRSCIGLAVSKTIGGPYTGIDTLVYSGMTTTGAFDGNSKRNTKWDKDYLNFKELIEAGVIEDANPKWFAADGSYNVGYAPNCIDPGIIKDDSTGEIWMAYGSWSAGIFMLEIDPKTGLAIYPGEDSGDSETGIYTDRYYGIHIAGGNPSGGNKVSGEAPYITYDEDTGYYYLYITYGGLTRTGGYNMRLFRSKSVTGPYLDAAGNDARTSFQDINNYGIKLIGNYQFTDQPEYRAAGHNSAYVAGDGNYYLVSHQRFDASKGEGHEVRVRQQFRNEDDWLVTAVYENKNEKIANYTDAEEAGIYEFVNHGLGEKDGNLAETKVVYLNTDGTVSGEETGTWSKKDSGKGYDYVTIKIGEVTYKGVFFKQNNDLNEETMTFTAIGDNNETIWGSHLESLDKVSLSMAEKALDEVIPGYANRTIELPTEVKGATVAWNSNNESVVSTSGTVTTQSSAKTVELTAVITYGKASKTKVYDVYVPASNTLIYGFDFEEEPEESSISAVSSSTGSNGAQLMGEAEIVEDEARGKVLQIKNEAGAKGVNFLQIAGDAFQNVNESGYTIAMWVNVGESSFIHSALFEADRSQAYPMTRVGVNMISRINANGYDDSAEHPFARNEWHHIAYAVNSTGIRVYVDGELLETTKKDISSCFDSANEWSIQHTTGVYVGSGYIWGDEDVRDAKFDDVNIYGFAYGVEDVNAIYKATKEHSLDQSTVTYIANKTVLEDTIAKAEAVKSSSCTAETYEAMQQALAAAKTIDAKSDATQKEVNAAKDELLNAYNALEKVLDKSDLEAAIVKVKAVNASGYTAESYANLQSALAEAEKVDTDTETEYETVAAHQAVVDAALKALNNAYDALEAVTPTPQPSSGSIVSPSTGGSTSAGSSTAAGGDSSAAAGSDSSAATGSDNASTGTTGTATTTETSNVKNDVVENVTVAEDGTVKDASGNVQKDSIVETTDGTKYITDENGKKRTDEVVTTTDGKKYAVEEDGAVAVDKVVTIDNKKYVATEDGTLATSEFCTTSTGDTVYASASGEVITSKLFKVDGKKYYATESGAIAKNKMVKVSGSTKVYTNKKGEVVTSQSFKIGTARYYAGKSGKVITNKWVTIGNKRYYCSASGKITKVKKIKK